MALIQFVLDLSTGLGLNHQAANARSMIALNVRLEIQQQQSFASLDDYDLRLGSFRAMPWGCFVAIGWVVCVGVNWVESIKF